MTSHEILVSKLCALLGRIELRDLIDGAGFGVVLGAQ
jgi:hypothetical protein